MLANSIRWLAVSLIALGGVALLGALVDTLTKPQIVASAANVQYVAPGGHCGGHSPCYASVQAAVDAAGNGGEIRVAAGTYTGLQMRDNITEVVYISKTLIVQGGYTSDNWTTADPAINRTTLDAQQQGIVLVVRGNISPTIAGLRLTGGSALGSGAGSDAGGGINFLSPNGTLRDNVVFANTAINGGGLFVADSAAALTGNTIMSNTTGGGFNAWGAGVYVYSGTATLSNNLIRGNYNFFGNGGGVYLDNSAASLSGNTIAGNTASRGGGVYMDSSAARLTGNIISGNNGNGYNPYSNGGMGGGGVYLAGSAASLSGNTISGNGVEYNRGGGLYLFNSPAALNNNAIRNNTGYYGFGAYLYASDATLTGNSISFNEHNGVDIDVSAVVLSHNIISNNRAGVSSSYSYLTLNDNVIGNNLGRGIDMHKGSATLSRNSIYHNAGFGVYLYALDDPVLISNTISYNGRGLSQYRRSMTMIGNLITNNGNWGTANSVVMFSPNSSHTTLINSVIADNAGGIAVGGSELQLIHTTIARNGGAIVVASHAALTNSIVANQTLGVDATPGSTATLNGVLWFGDGTKYSGPGTVNVSDEHNGDPAFAFDGYHLTAASAAIDAGVAAGVAADIDGQARPHGAAPDLGADEYYFDIRGVFLPLVER